MTRHPPRTPVPVSGVLLVAAGGLLGSGARSVVGLVLDSGQTSFPASTLLANLLGSFLLGSFISLRARNGWRKSGPLQFWALGVLGSFTTFSAFGFEVFEMLAAGRTDLAGGYVLASVGGGLAAALLGGRIGRVAV